MTSDTVAKMAYESLSKIRESLDKYDSLKYHYPECAPSMLSEISLVVNRYIGIFAHLSKDQDGCQEEMASPEQ